MALYDKLDDAIITSIGQGCRAFLYIRCSEPVRNESALIASLNGSESFRIVDRRLQALRRAGKIGFVPTGKKWPGGGGWFLVANQAGE